MRIVKFLLLGIFAFTSVASFAIDIPEIIKMSDVEEKPVLFHHGEHQAAVSECLDCHHTGMDQPRCNSCHGVDRLIPRLKSAFHHQCRNCHIKNGGPTDCNGCHK